MTSSFCRTARFFVPFAFAAVTACSSDNVVAPPPGSSATSETERDDVAENFTNPIILDALFGADADGSNALVLETVSANVKNVGSIDISIGSPQALSNRIPGVKQTVLPVRTAVQVESRTFKAFAGQLVLELTDAHDAEFKRMTWMGVIAMDNLSNPTEIVIAGISKGPVPSIPSSMSNTPFGKNESEDGPEANAQYLKKVGNEYVLYEEVSGGGMTISSSSYGSSKGCSTTGFTSLIGFEGVGVSSCSFSHGSMKGNFTFTGANSGMAQTITVSLPSFNLPSSRTVIAATVDEGNN